jgi:hypothetical protein
MSLSLRIGIVLLKPHEDNINLELVGSPQLLGADELTTHERCYLVLEMFWGSLTADLVSCIDRSANDTFVSTK